MNHCQNKQTNKQTQIDKVQDVLINYFHPPPTLYRHSSLSPSYDNLDI